MVGLILTNGYANRVRLPESIARVKGKTSEKVPLDAQPLPLNVARCLDIEQLDVRLVEARPEDLTTTE